MRIILLSFLLLIFWSCQKRIVDESELKTFLMDPENGLIKKSENKDITIEVIYRPSELLSCQQIKGEEDADERKSIIDNFDSLTYFIVRLSRNGEEIENEYAGDSEQFTAMVNHLSSTIGNDFYLVNKQDTIKTLDVSYTRMFGSGSGTSVLTVFDTKLEDENGEVVLCFNDSYFGLGMNQFEFSLKDIKNTPTLNLY
jgi:hypothetical protein